MLCPVIVDNTYSGYLVLTRETPGAFYSNAEVELARDIAGELALACSSARAMERLRAGSTDALDTAPRPRWPLAELAPVG